MRTRTHNDGQSLRARTNRALSTSDTSMAQVVVYKTKSKQDKNNKRLSFGCKGLEASGMQTVLWKLEIVDRHVKLNEIRSFLQVGRATGTTALELTARFLVILQKQRQKFQRKSSKCSARKID